ncbi:MAG TPA: hypothetical protein VFF28_05495 [Candidatus Nanoarchaeia archaeon]|nr:hypothetical protein [Candidatus Nanoarchaeia archaeon]
MATLYQQQVSALQRNNFAAKGGTYRHYQKDESLEGKTYSFGVDLNRSGSFDLSVRANSSIPVEPESLGEAVNAYDLYISQMSRCIKRSFGKDAQICATPPHTLGVNAIYISGRMDVGEDYLKLKEYIQKKGVVV